MQPTSSRLSVTACLLTLCGLGFAPGGASARDRPPAPSDVVATAVNSTAIAVSFRNNAPRDELVRFEVEVTINGERAPAAYETGMSSGLPLSGTGDGWLPFHGPRFFDLLPETDYCFRFWSRVADTGVVSDNPSEWGCAHTPANPPLAPLDVTAVIRTLINPEPLLTWSTADQSDHRGVARFLVDRQSPPGPNRPWIFERSIAGPGGRQSSSTRLNFSVVFPKIDPKIETVYRICAENDGGRSCAQPVRVQIDNAVLRAPEGVQPKMSSLVPPARVVRLAPRGNQSAAGELVPTPVPQSGLSNAASAAQVPPLAFPPAAPAISAGAPAGMPSTRAIATAAGNNALLGIHAINGRTTDIALLVGEKIVITGLGLGEAFDARIVGGALDRAPVPLQILRRTPTRIDAQVPLTARGSRNEKKAAVEVRTSTGARYRFDGVSFIGGF
jgi:hypothetical protein